MHNTAYIPARAGLHRPSPCLPAATALALTARRLVRVLLALACWLVLVPPAVSAADPALERFVQGRFEWHLDRPLIGPLQRPGDFTYSVKDPSIVFYQGHWHLFCTIRSRKRSHQIEYIRFQDWSSLHGAHRRLLKLTAGYFCAPQVFYFRPHRKWYLIYQVIDESRKPALQPAYSTTTDIDDPNTWTAPELLFTRQPANVKKWIDFWVICDQSSAQLFFTSPDGRLWRAETPLESFPQHWSQPQVVLRADIFEAAHIYRLKGLDEYLAIIEAQGPAGRRYYKAYLASSLTGSWQPLADSYDKPFASSRNTYRLAENWTDSFSHGELLRLNYDQTPTVDPTNLRFLFQGVRDEDRRGKPYGQIPWRLGLLGPR